MPSLVFIDFDSDKLITYNGRDMVDQDTEANDFPWEN